MATLLLKLTPGSFPHARPRKSMLTHRLTAPSSRAAHHARYKLLSQAGSRTCIREMC